MNTLQSKLQHHFNRNINEDSVVRGVALVPFMNEYNLMHTFFQAFLHSASWRDGIPFDYGFTDRGSKKWLSFYCFCTADELSSGRSMSTHNYILCRTFINCNLCQDA